MNDEFTYDYDDFPGPRRLSKFEQKQRAAARKAELVQHGESINPVSISGTKIAKTFWGQKWCDHLEAYHDYENRLPRGRSYIRSGCIIDLKIEAGLVIARVQGDALYDIQIRIRKLDEELWDNIVKRSAGEISSVLDLMSGKLPESVIKILTDPKLGVFPLPTEVKMACTCPDYATVCKHVAAVLYGVGHRLDTNPELFFTLRSVNYAELISKAGSAIANAAAAVATEIDSQEILDIFGIEIDS